MELSSLNILADSNRLKFDSTLFLWFLRWKSQIIVHYFIKKEMTQNAQKVLSKFNKYYQSYLQAGQKVLIDLEHKINNEKCFIVYPFMW